MGLRKPLDLLSMYFHEFTARQQSPRIPEPKSEMDEDTNVIAFHKAGESGGLLEPIYIFNANYMSNLLGIGSHVLDLGCGSGQAIKYLSFLRPDLKITGVDLSKPMIELGMARLKELNLTKRVTLIQGDMTDLRSLNLGKIDLISSIFSFHHLPTIEIAKKCAHEVKHLMSTTGCSFWCFDHIRPRSENTAVLFPKVFSANAPLALQIDSTNSLKASFTFHEMKELFKDLCEYGLRSQRSNLMPFYQTHWVRRDEISQARQTLEYTRKEMRFDLLMKLKKL